jgi:4-oxalomesaconate tautomerase
VTVRSYIPQRTHASVGVFGAVSVATSCLIDGSPAAKVAVVSEGPRKVMSVEHPSGESTCVIEVDKDSSVVSSATLRTARKLMEGRVFV